MFRENLRLRNDVRVVIGYIEHFKNFMSYDMGTEIPNESIGELQNYWNKVLLLIDPESRLSSAEWSGYLGILVTDPDGWDRKNFNESWAEPISREEFLARAFSSTTDYLPYGMKKVTR